MWLRALGDLRSARDSGTDVFSRENFVLQSEHPYCVWPWIGINVDRKNRLFIDSIAERLRARARLFSILTR